MKISEDGGMIDVHAHFADEGYDLPAEVDNIAAAGVKRVILASDSIPHAKFHADFAVGHDGYYFTAGVHPSECESIDDSTLEEISKLCKNPKCVAVGEIGLDFHYDGSDRALQEKTFIEQIRLAEDAGLPVQIHARDCSEDILRIVRSEKSHLINGFLLHCYSQGAEMMKEFIKLGAYFSFGGVSCFKNAKSVWESVRTCPLDRILTETDSPYLSPYRGEKNSPANIPVILARLAELKETDKEELEAQITANAENLFPKLK